MVWVILVMLRAPEHDPIPFEEQKDLLRMLL